MTCACHPQYQYWKHWKKGPTNTQNRAHVLEGLGDNTVFCIPSFDNFGSHIDNSSLRQKIRLSNI